MYCMEQQLYELAYHIEPEVEETQVAPLKVEIEKLVTDQSGNIVYSKDPEKTRLSYPIKHERMSYFGYLHFSLPDITEAIAHIDEQLRLNNHIMRHLIIKLDMRKKSAPKLSSTTDRRPKKEIGLKKEDNKDLEKQLEDVISGL